MFDVTEAKKLVDNMRHGIYPSALEYLTKERGLTQEVLEKYRVGLGTEKFTNDDGHLSGFDSIYFPIYLPRPKAKEKKADSKQSKAEQREQEAREFVETDTAQLVKIKIRAAYKENKKLQRFLPVGSKFR